MDIRTRGQFPTLNSEILRNYLTPDGAKNREASRDLFRQYGLPIETTVSERLRKRHGELASEVIQEAWVRCLSELQSRKADFMKSRAERPSVGLLMASYTMRAVWTLEQRARRERARIAPESSAGGAPEPSSERVADTDITPEDFHVIFEAAWRELLQVSLERERAALLEVGPVVFFAGDWRVDASDRDDEQTELVLKCLDAVRGILRRILAERYGLKSDAISRFLRWLLPA